MAQYVCIIRMLEGHHALFQDAAAAGAGLRCVGCSEGEHVDNFARAKRTELARRNALWRLRPADATGTAPATFGAVVPPALSSPGHSPPSLLYCLRVRHSAVTS
eukprot:2457840-Pleurochrysis_carterae.AAC.8